MKAVYIAIFITAILFTNTLAVPCTGSGSDLIQSGIYQNLFRNRIACQSKKIKSINLWASLNKLRYSIKRISKCFM